MSIGTAPDPDNYVLGRGKCSFTPKGGTKRDLGNAPALTVSVAIQWLEHFSSRGGLKVKDKRVAMQLTPTISFTLDEPVGDNLALTFLGSNTAGTIAAFTVPSIEGLFEFESDNPTGPNYIMSAWEVSIGPDGETGFISDNWMEMKFKAEVLKSADPAHADSPYMDIEVVLPA
jgi:hypothetical protein